jgi:hypothetical protein
MPANADPSINRTFHGIVIDSSDEFEHADDPIRVHLESDQVSERSSYSEQLANDTEKVKKHFPNNVSSFPGSSREMITERLRS